MSHCFISSTPSPFLAFVTKICHIKTMNTKPRTPTDLPDLLASTVSHIPFGNVLEFSSVDKVHFVKHDTNRWPIPVRWQLNHFQIVFWRIRQIHQYQDHIRFRNGSSNETHHPFVEDMPRPSQNTWIVQQHHLADNGMQPMM